MFAPRFRLIPVILLAAIAGPASAQQIVSRQVTPNGLVGGYPGYGVGSGNYEYTTAYGTYGLPGYYSGYAGNPLAGYGPGVPVVGSYVTRSFPPVVPGTYNNMGGLINTIRSQTGRSNSYSYGSNYGVARRRRVR